ncbi:major facilitator superfamily permease [Klebsiella michiganensis]|uniref:Major facilitator superfamily permease n=1 Tax=Klebsiella michiganensis TaxID=1134687 RepID=A0A7H4PI86_9ENTR|nr:major facilitator superfamily permease [Klebsiella michiganensis]
MSIGIALFYFATNMPRLIAIQLFFGLVANAVWPIYYAMASDSAEERATSTANGIITTAMFIGGGISPLLMGWLIQFGGGWGKIRRVISTPSLPWRDARCWGCYCSL